MRATAATFGAIALSAAGLLAAGVAGCTWGNGTVLQPDSPRPRPPTAVSPTDPTAATPASPPAPEQARLPFVERFDDPTLAGWYPIGRGVAQRTADGKLLLEEVMGSAGFSVLHEAVFGDRIVIEFDCQPLRYAGHPSVVFSASRSGRPFAADPSLRDPTKQVELLSVGRLQFYMLGWHTAWRADEFPAGPGESKPVAKALLQRYPDAKLLAAVPDAKVAPDQQTHRFRIVKDAEQITVDVDGVRKMDVLDAAPLRAGQLGFRIRGDRTGSFRCLIDNLKVTALP